METSLIIAVAALTFISVALALWSWGKSRHQAEALTTEALVAAAQDALDNAQRLADARARAIEADQAALAADRNRIAAARARMAGNAAPAA